MLMKTVLLAMKILTGLGVEVMLSMRVDLSSKTKSTLRTCDGRHISAELIVSGSTIIHMRKDVGT